MPWISECSSHRSYHFLLLSSSFLYIEYHFLGQEPCSYYNQLSTADRAHSYVATGSVLCDSGLATQWYRFTGSAGSNIRTSCVADYGSKYRCNTHAGGWLNGALPSISDGEVVRTACFAYSSSCCTWARIVKVKHCAAGYYVYFLKSPGSCSLRFCGNA